jgi:hypothetical protein
VRQGPTGLLTADEQEGLAALAHPPHAAAGLEVDGGHATGPQRDGTRTQLLCGALWPLAVVPASIGRTGGLGRVVQTPSRSTGHGRQARMDLPGVHRVCQQRGSQRIGPLHLLAWAFIVHPRGRPYKVQDLP